MYSIINFDRKNFLEILKNIEASRGYISFIDSKQRKGKENKRYKKYLDMKQVLYTAKPPHLSEGSIYAYKWPEWITQSKINELHDKYGVQDDYYIEKKLVSEHIIGNNIGTKVFTQEAVPIESIIFEDSLEVDKQLETLNRSCLNEKFLMNNHRRFLLLPFVAKHNDKYVEPIVIANVYDIGIITIQLILCFEHDKVIELPETPPRDIKFSEIYFNKTVDNYTIEDFWNKELKKNISADGIMEVYEKQLALLSKVELSYNPDNRPVSWTFGDFTMKKDYENHEEFIDKYKRLYVSHLTNGIGQVTQRRSEKDTNQLIDDSTIIRNGEMCYFCSPTSSIVSLGFSTFKEIAEEFLSEDEKELKKQGVYQDHLNSIFKIQTLMASLQYLRFYELTFIKRYFLIKLLDEISQDTYKTLKDYNSVKKNLNFIKIQYDEEVLFFTEGSPKELYKSILEKSNVNNLLSKAESMVKDVREDVNNFRDLEIKKNETLILIITSLLTILLGYNGIKLIVYDVLANFPIIEAFVSKHPLRYTITIWFILILIMVGLNLRRWLINNK